MGDPYEAYDDVVVVQTVGGKKYRVLETEGPSAMGFAEKIARDGVWITGGPILFIPAHQVAHVELVSPAEYEKRGKARGVEFRA